MRLVRRLDLVRVSRNVEMGYMARGQRKGRSLVIPMRESKSRLAVVWRVLMDGESRRGLSFTSLGLPRGS